jgi:hypothetical protein
MAKAGELDWSELKKNDDYKHKPTVLWVNDPSSGVSPKGSDVKPLLKNNQIPDKQTDEEIRAIIMSGMDKPGLRQPTDEELFGAGVISQEQVDKAEAEFNNKIANFFAEASKPLTGQTEVPDEEWGCGKSFNSTLSKSQLDERNKYTGE